MRVRTCGRVLTCSRPRDKKSGGRGLNLDVGPDPTAGRGGSWEGEVWERKRAQGQPAALRIEQSEAQRAGRWCWPSPGLGALLRHRPSCRLFLWNQGGCARGLESYSRSMQPKLKGDRSVVLHVLVATLKIKRKWVKLVLRTDFLLNLTHPKCYHFNRHPVHILLFFLPRVLHLESLSFGISHVPSAQAACGCGSLLVAAGSPTPAGLRTTPRQGWKTCWARPAHECDGEPRR